MKKIFHREGHLKKTLFKLMQIETIQQKLFYNKTHVQKYINFLQDIGPAHNPI